MLSKFGAQILIAVISLLVAGCNVQVLEPSSPSGNNQTTTGGGGNNQTTTPPDLVFKYSGTFSQVSLYDGLEDGSGWVDSATSANAKFSNPNLVTSDGTNLYVVDTNTDYVAIREISIATGAVTTLTDSISNSALLISSILMDIEGIATDGTYVYVTDATYNYYNNTVDNEIVQILIADPTNVSVLAGAAEPNDGSSIIEQEGTGSSANFAAPGALLVYGSNLFVADGATNWGGGPGGYGYCTVFRVSLASGTRGQVSYVINSPDGCYPGGDGGSTPTTTSDLAAPLGLAAMGSTSDPTIYVLQSAYANYQSTPLISQITTAVSSPSLSELSTLTTNVGSFVGSATGLSMFGDGTNLYLTGEEDSTGTSQMFKADLMSNTVSVLAGQTGSGYVNATGAAALFSDTGIQGVAAGGNFYVADGDNFAVRKVTPAGVVTTFAGVAPNGDPTSSVFSSPHAVVVVNGTSYVADFGNNVIDKVTSDGTVTAFVGDGTCPVSTPADATGTAAEICEPEGITSDGTNLYIADSGDNLIRKVVIATGAVTTLAGSYDNGGYWQDGTGTGAYFNVPWGITISLDKTTLYITENGNWIVRKIVISSQVVTTIAGGGGTCSPTIASQCGTGSTNGNGTAALFESPEGITTDGSNLYVADAEAIRQISLSGPNAVTTLAGGDVGGFQDGTGGAAAFSAPFGLAISSDLKTLYVADNVNNLIRQIVIATGVVTTVDHSGETSAGTTVSDTGGFYRPAGVFYSSGSLYVVSDDATLRVLTFANQTITTLAGSPYNAYSGLLDGSTGIGTFIKGGQLTTDGTNIYMTDGNLVREISLSTGVISTIAGRAYNYSGFSDGVGLDAGFNSPTGITTDGTSLYVVDSTNQAIRKVNIATGKVTTISALGAAAGGIATNGYHLYFTLGNQIYQENMDGTSMQLFAGGYGSGFQDGSAFSAEFGSALGSIVTDDVNLYVVDSGNFAIRQINLASGTVTTLAGGTQGYQNGTGTSGWFQSGMGAIATDGVNVYVTDGGNYAIREISISGGTVSSMIYASRGAYSGQGDGLLASSSVVDPTGLVCTAQGLFMMDSVPSGGTYTAAALRQIH
jgi:hypothetical protein